MDALAGFVEQAEGPTVGAAEGAVVLAEGVGGGLHLGNDGVWAGEGGEDGEVGGGDGADVGVEGLVRVAFGGAVQVGDAGESCEVGGWEEREG